MTQDTQPIVCPDTHQPGHPSAPSHCPAWCAGDHDPLLWLECCNIAVHSAPLATSPDGRLSVRLSAAELPADQMPGGLESPGLAVEVAAAGFLDGLSPAQVDELAATLARAADAARALRGEWR